MCGLPVRACWGRRVTGAGRPAALTRGREADPEGPSRQFGPVGRLAGEGGPMLPPFGWQAVFTQWQAAPRCHGVRRLAGRPVPVGRRTGGATASRPAVAGLADRDVPGRARRRRAGAAERHRHLRRRAVLGPHGPAPDAHHGGPAAADLRAADHAAAAREPQSAAHLGQADPALAGGELPDLAGVRVRRLCRGDRGAPSDRLSRTCSRGTRPPTTPSTWCSSSSATCSSSRSSARSRSGGGCPTRPS